MPERMYNVYFEYGDRGDGKPRHDEYKNVCCIGGGVIGGGVKEALMLSFIRFYSWYGNEVEITKVVIEKVKTK